MTTQCGKQLPFTYFVCVLPVNHSERCKFELVPSVYVRYEREGEWSPWIGANSVKIEGNFIRVERREGDVLLMPGSSITQAHVMSRRQFEECSKEDREEVEGDEVHPNTSIED